MFNCWRAVVARFLFMVSAGDDGKGLPLGPALSRGIKLQINRLGSVRGEDGEDSPSRSPE